MLKPGYVNVSKQPRSDLLFILLQQHSYVKPMIVYIINVVVIACIFILCSGKIDAHSVPFHPVELNTLTFTLLQHSSEKSLRSEVLALRAISFDYLSSDIHILAGYHYSSSR